jgi:hypothetical protein
MSDDLLVITQFGESREAARTLLWKRVNERLHARGTRARLSSSPLPPGLTLDTALSRLKAAIANLTRVLNQQLVDVPSNTLWLVLGRVPIPLNKSSIEYELERLFNSPAAAHVDADFWKREIVDPMKEHADKIRAWVKTLKKRAGRDQATVAPPLTAHEQAVLEVIKKHPDGIQGGKILSILAKRGRVLDQSTLTRHIIPKLRDWYRVRNRRGVGYYIPPE